MHAARYLIGSLVTAAYLILTACIALGGGSGTEKGGTLGSLGSAFIRAVNWLVFSAISIYVLGRTVLELLQLSSPLVHRKNPANKMAVRN